ncbi:flavodoxin family protein [Halonatronum saccharophilum]|uniref:flavodoxin family protein n=1 Tax=Halonatronum saccharophilum TaxID=150060 RepID=UPI00048797C8|nr:flavodoxin family protein [Halonatronum saccharophilum]
MKVLGINGSPNKNGNTVVLLEEALEGAKKEGAKVELIHIRDALKELNEPFCTHCSSPCLKVCYKGTLLEEQFEKLAQADGIILGSPVYFGTSSGQLKAFWDMTRALRSEKALFDTVGGAISVGASRYGGQETTIKALHDMMFIQGMLVVGDGIKEGNVGHQGACSQKPAKEDLEGKKQSKALGMRVVRVAKSTS